MIRAVDPAPPGLAPPEPAPPEPAEVAVPAPRLKVVCLPTGPDEYAAAVIRALADRAEILALASPGWGARYASDLPDGVRLETMPWPRHRDPRNLLMAWRILRALRSFQPDIVHFLGESLLWLALFLPWLRRWPLVVTVHEAEYHPGDAQSRTLPMGPIRLFRRAMDGVIVHGQGQADLLAADGVRPAGGSHIVPHPVLDRHARLAGDGPRAASGRPEEGGPRLLFFGRVMLYKGLAVLLEAGDRLILRHPGLRLVVAGTGPELERLRPELQKRAWVELRDTYVPDAAVPDLFTAADMVVLPYIEASQSGVAALAAGFAKPVVASRVGELGQLVEESGMGVLVPPGDPAALAEAISRLHEDGALAESCRSAAAAAARGPMSPAAVAGLTLEAYAEIIESRAAASR